MVNAVRFRVYQHIQERTAVSGLVWGIWPCCILPIFMIGWLELSYVHIDFESMLIVTMRRLTGFEEFLAVQADVTWSTQNVSVRGPLPLWVRYMLSESSAVEQILYKMEGNTLLVGFGAALKIAIWKT